MGLGHESFRAAGVIKAEAEAEAEAEAVAEAGAGSEAGSETKADADAEAEAEAEAEADARTFEKQCGRGQLQMVGKSERQGLGGRGADEKKPLKREKKLRQR